MAMEKQYGGADYFRMAAAFLVAAIHTSPLASFSGKADFILTRVFARVAVPFFFMVTGYFLLPQYLLRHSMDLRPLKQLFRKLFILYGAAMLLYLPINIYAGQLGKAGAGELLRMILVEGTFYHLWYLPAVMLSVAVVWFLGQKLPFFIMTLMSFLLYLAGLFGDSYYGAAEQIPALKSAYELLFSVSSHTRNGLFYAPLFLVMGAGISRMEHKDRRERGRMPGREEPRAAKKKHRGMIAADMACFGICLGLMTAEGLLLHGLKMQRHDSMYVMLPAVMFFLFRLLVSLRIAPVKWFRSVSMWIYLFHPFCIILVRGWAKAVHLESLLVENSLLHYLAVCAVSLGCGCAAAVMEGRIAAAKGKKEGFHFAKGRAWIELDREHLIKNVRTLESLLSPGQRLMPAVKADAYGHGAILIAGELQKAGIGAFCVACAAEGVKLRKSGITGEILVLGYTHPKDFFLLRKYNLIQTVVDYAYGRLLNSYGKKIRVHVKVDTGMHRLGERAEKKQEIDRIFRLKNLRVEGIFTHLSADETKEPAELAFTKRQAALFYEIAEYRKKKAGGGKKRRLKDKGASGIKTHLLASYGLINYPELGGDYVRCGIALYGLLGDRQSMERYKGRVALLPVMSVKARIAVVKELYKGESVGYGLEYETEEDRKIAVLSIGYADGLPRSLSAGRGRVLIHGQSVPVAGRICMDQMIVDITGISGVKAGETAVILGREGGEEITAYELAEKTETITNEIMSRLGERLERIWGN